MWDFPTCGICPREDKMNKEVQQMGAPKYSDEKGRLLLGKEFANTPFLIEKQANGEIVLKPSVTIPVNEGWLLKNANALDLVALGISNARAKKFVPSPMNENDESWLSQIDDE